MKVLTKIVSMAKAIFFRLLGIRAESEYDLNDLGLTDADIRADLPGL